MGIGLIYTGLQGAGCQKVFPKLSCSQCRLYDLQTGSVKPHQLDEVDWSVTLVDTGLQTMTGGESKGCTHLLEMKLSCSPMGWSSQC